MAEGLNRVTLIGNLGQAPELRFTQSGTPVASLRIATTESFINRDKEKQERTEWHSVVIWGKRGDGLARYLEKGSKVCVEGRLQTRSWEAKDGSKRYATEIVATNVVLLGGGKRNGHQADDGQSEPPPPPADGNDFGDDDIPF